MLDNTISSAALLIYICFLHAVLRFIFHKRIKAGLDFQYGPLRTKVLKFGAPEGTPLEVVSQLQVSSGGFPHSETVVSRPDGNLDGQDLGLCGDDLCFGHGRPAPPRCNRSRVCVEG